MIIPTLQALILAEHVYQDAATGKKIIAGTFNKVLYCSQAKEYPTQVTADGETVAVVPGGTSGGTPWLFVSLTDVVGEVELGVRYVDLKHMSVLMQTTFKVSSQDRLQTQEVILPMPYLPTPHTGTYALELLYDQSPLGTLRVLATDTADEDEENEHS